MKKLTILFLFVTLSISIINSCSTTTDNSSEVFEIRVGVLLGLTGSDASRGAELMTALDIAQKEINTFLEQNKYAFRMKLIIEDTQTDTNVCLQKIQGLSTKGVRFIIGPTTSAEAKAIKGYADQNNLLLISPSAVAPSLSIANDNFFRLVTSDSLQARAMFKMLTQNNFSTLVPIIRDDVWANELCNILIQKFQNAGLYVAQTIRFDPKNTIYTPTLEILNDIVNSLKNMGYSEEQIAVYFLSFDEGSNYLREANNFETLKSVRWFGGSAFALNKNILMDAQAGEFAKNVNFIAPINAFDENYRYKWEPVVAQIQARIGKMPTIYSINAIDILWLITQTYISAGILTDFQTMKTLFVSMANSYIGLNGPTTLNQYGDRKDANYEFWGIEQSGTTYTWIRKALYISSSDEIIYYK